MDNIASVTVKEIYVVCEVEQKEIPTTSGLRNRKQLFPRRNLQLFNGNQDEPVQKKPKTQSTEPQIKIKEMTTSKLHSPSSQSNSNKTQVSSSVPTNSKAKQFPDKQHLNDTKLSPLVLSLSSVSAVPTMKRVNITSLATTETRKTSQPAGIQPPRKYTITRTDQVPLPIGGENQQTKEINKISHSKIIEHLLKDKPTQTIDETKVSSIVSGILSKTGKPRQKYVVMPIAQPSTSSSKCPQPATKYVLVNTASVSSPGTIRSKTTPYKPLPLVIKPYATSVNRYRYQNLSSPVCCTAVISSAVDTVKKWLDCNRDILSKTLIGIAEHLSVTTMVSTLLLRFKHMKQEHVATKWIGIALMLLTKYQIKEATGTNGKPIPSQLCCMWNNLRSFFTIYEGCLQIVRKERSIKNTNDSSPNNELKLEDQIFENIVGNIFTEYNKVTSGEDLPTTVNLQKLSAFIGTLVDEGNSNLSYSDRRGQGITSVLLQSPSHQVSHITKQQRQCWSACRALTKLTKIVEKTK